MLWTKSSDELALVFFDPYLQGSNEYINEINTMLSVRAISTWSNDSNIDFIVKRKIFIS